MYSCARTLALSIGQSGGSTHRELQTTCALDIVAFIENVQCAGCAECVWFSVDSLATDVHTVNDSGRQRANNVPNAIPMHCFVHVANSAKTHNKRKKLVLVWRARARSFATHYERGSHRDVTWTQMCWCVCVCALFFVARMRTTYDWTTWFSYEWRNDEWLLYSPNHPQIAWTRRVHGNKS